MAASPRPGPSARRRRALPRHTCAAVACALLLAGGAFPAAALLDGVTGGPAAGARLSVPGAYVALAPLSDVLDTLSLFTVPQHAALVATLALAYLLVRVLAARAHGTSIAREAGRCAVFAIALVALYAALALLPRPMARLELARADELAVDVHAHTDASHDGRRGFTAERVRAWHRESGFAAVYVTDHRAFAGAAAGVRANPLRASLGTSVFSGIEVVSDRHHVNVLGAAAADSAHFPHGTVDPDSLADFHPADGAPAVVVLTIPGSVTRISPQLRLGAVELSDAAPRGLGSAEQQHADILRLAGARHLALVAGSDNHGWGRTAAAWTVLSIPGWREMAPVELDHAIRHLLLLAPERVRVIERRRPRTGGAAALVATAPRAAWLMARTISWPERGVWIAWIALAVLFRALARRRRTNDG